MNFSDIYKNSLGLTKAIHKLPIVAFADPNILRREIFKSLKAYIFSSNLSEEKKSILVNNVKVNIKRYISSFEQFYNTNKNYIDNVIDYDKKEKWLKKHGHEYRF